MLFIVGLTFLLPGETLASSPAYRAFLDRMPEGMWGVFCMAVGLARFASLIINGYWRSSPVLRACAALIGAVIWSQFAFFFLVASEEMNVLSLGVAYNLVMLGADLFSAARAASDAVHSRRAHAVLDR